MRMIKISYLFLHRLGPLLSFQLETIARVLTYNAVHRLRTRVYDHLYRVRSGHRTALLTFVYFSFQMTSGVHVRPRRSPGETRVKDVEIVFASADAGKYVHCVYTRARNMYKIKCMCSRCDVPTRRNSARQRFSCARFASPRRPVTAR